MFTNADTEPRFGATVLQTPYGLGQDPITVSDSLLAFLRHGDPKNDWTEAFSPRSREDAELNPWDPSIKAPSVASKVLPQTSYDKIVSGPRGEAATAMANEVKAVVESQEARRQKLTARTLLAGIHTPSLDGDANSLDTGVRQGDDANAQATSEGSVSTMGGTAAADDASVSTTTSRKSAV